MGLTETINNLNARISEQVDNYQPPESSGGSGTITQEVDPTVPSWAKASKKPTYSASEVGAYSKAEVDTKLQQKQNVLEIDDVVSEGSSNPISSRGVNLAIKNTEAKFPTAFNGKSAGLVPQSNDGDEGKFLSSNGSWGFPINFLSGVSNSEPDADVKVVENIPTNAIIKHGTILKVLFTKANDQGSYLLSINGVEYWLNDRYEDIMYTDSAYVCIWFLYDGATQNFSPFATDYNWFAPQVETRKLIINTDANTALKTPQNPLKSASNWGSIYFVKFTNGNTAVNPKIKTDEFPNGEDLYDIDGKKISTFNVPSNTVCILRKNSFNGFVVVAVITDNTEKVSLLEGKVDTIQNLVAQSAPLFEFVDCLVGTTEEVDAYSRNNYQTGDYVATHSQNGTILKKVTADIPKNTYIDGDNCEEATLADALTTLARRIKALEDKVR